MFAHHSFFHLPIRCSSLKLCLLFGLVLHARRLYSLSFRPCLLDQGLSMTLTSNPLHLSQPGIRDHWLKLENASSWLIQTIFSPVIAILPLSSASLMQLVVVYLVAHQSIHPFWDSYSSSFDYNLYLQVSWSILWTSPGIEATFPDVWASWSSKHPYSAVYRILLHRCWWIVWVSSSWMSMNHIYDVLYILLDLHIWIWFSSV